MVTYGIICCIMLCITKECGRLFPCRERIKMDKSKKKKGLFLVFEGLDGSGKSTHVRLLSKKLRAQGHVCYETREPTDGPVGATVHHCMTGRLAADPNTIAALFAADRTDHVFNAYNGILSKVENGVTVLTDRYALSSLAYNGSEVPLRWVKQLNSRVMEVLPPDCTIFIDIDPRLAMNRIGKRDVKEKYETEAMLKIVRERYMELMEKHYPRGPYVIVNGDNDIETVSEAIWTGLKEKGIV